jgi:hypothetical protein
MWQQMKEGKRTTIVHSVREYIWNIARNIDDYRAVTKTQFYTRLLWLQIAICESLSDLSGKVLSII